MTKFLSLLIACFVASAFAHSVADGSGSAESAGSKSAVVVLTQANFEEIVSSDRPTLVEFYAPWCGHCRNLEPAYNALANELAVNSVPVTIAKVDCMAEKSVSEKHGIKGFPTIKLFQKDKLPVHYRLARDVASFKQFLANNGVPIPGVQSVAPAPPAQPTPPPPPPQIYETHLRYFETRGRAELIRLLLEDVRAPYKDTRFTWDQWVAEKPNAERYAFGQMPQLTADGVDLVQSGAIIRYLARKYGMYGYDTSQGVTSVAAANFAATVVDMVLGGVEDLRTKYNTLVYDKEFANKRTEFVEKVLPVWLPHFERLLTRGGGVWFANGRFSVADLAVFEVLQLQTDLAPNCLNGHGTLVSFMSRVLARPNINQYLKSDRRPKYAHGSSAFWSNEANPAPPLVV